MFICSSLNFIWAVFQGDSLRTNIQLDFGDGIAVSYSNLSWTEEGIKHVYRSAGIFRVTALAENTLGYDTTTLFLHVTCKCNETKLHIAFMAVLLEYEFFELNFFNTPPPLFFFFHTYMCPVCPAFLRTQCLRNVLREFL